MFYKLQKTQGLMRTSGLIVSLLYATSLSATPEIIEVVGHQNAQQVTLPLADAVQSSPDMRDVFDQLPGVSINHNGPLTAVMQYRGLLGDRILVNVDGIKLAGAGPNAMDSPISHVTNNPYKNITLFRGIAPVSAGAEAIGGAIKSDYDFTRLFSTETQVTGQLRTTYIDNADGWNHQAQLLLSDEHTFVLANWLTQQGNNSEDGRGLTRPNSMYARDGGEISVGYQHNNHRLSAHYHRLNTGQTGTAALAMDINYIDAAFYRLSYDADLEALGSVKLSIYGNNNQHEMDNHSLRPVANPMAARANLVDSVAQGASAHWQQDVSFADVKSGVDFYQQRHNSTIRNPLAGSLQIVNFNNIHRRQVSVFTQIANQYDHARSMLGLRYTKISADAGEVAHSMAMMNPAIAGLVNQFNQQDRQIDTDWFDLTAHLEWSMSDALQVTLAGGLKGRAPSYTEWFVWFPLGISAGLADGFNYLGNTSLTHEYAKQLDVGLDYRRKRWHFSANLFAHHIDDYIVGDIAPAMPASMLSSMMNPRPLLIWQNRDAEFYGFEADVLGQLNDQWALQIALEYVRATRTDLNEPLFRIAPFKAVTQLVYQHEQLRVSLQAEYVDTQDRVSLIQMETPSDSYTLLHLETSYKVNQHVSFGLNFRNLLDKAYQPHLAGVNRVGDAEVPLGERLFAIGRTVSASVTLNF